MKSTSNHLLLVILIFVALAGGCQQNGITSVWVPKESAEARAPMAAAANDHPQISWTVPEGWTEQPPSDMRVGSFVAKGQNGQSVDISVIPLSGPAGGMLANINRWRGQIQLPPIEASDLSSEAKLITTGPHQMHLVDFVSSEPLIDNKHKKRIVAAISERPGQTCFFKMTGEDEAVKAAVPAFKKFLSGVQFND